VSAPALVIAAHGSADPRFAEVVESIAQRLLRLRPDVDVRVGFVDHGPPDLRAVATAGCVVVPLFLASGYHVRTDVPSQAPDAVVAAAVGPDPRLASALADRLHDAGYDGDARVVLAAAGSSDADALRDVAAAASLLSERLHVDVRAAFVSAGEPRLDDALREWPDAVVASYLIAPGVFHETVVASGASVVSAPIGDHPAVAAVVIDRYAATLAGQVPGRTAPA